MELKKIKCLKLILTSFWFVDRQVYISVSMNSVMMQFMRGFLIEIIQYVPLSNMSSFFSCIKKGIC